MAGTRRNPVETLLDDRWDTDINPKHNFWKVVLPGKGDRAVEYKDGVLRPSGVGVSFGYTTSPRCVEMVASKGMKFKGETRTEKELEHFVRGAVGPSIYVGWRMEDDTAFGTTLNLVNHFVATYQQVWDPPKSQLSLTPPPRC